MLHRIGCKWNEMMDRLQGRDHMCALQCGCNRLCACFCKLFLSFMLHTQFWHCSVVLQHLIISFCF